MMSSSGSGAGTGRSPGPDVEPKVVSAAHLLDHVAAQAFRRAYVQFVFCFGPASKKSEASKMFMAVCIKRLTAHNTAAAAATAAGI